MYIGNYIKQDNWLNLINCKNRRITIRIIITIHIILYRIVILMSNAISIELILIFLNMCYCRCLRVTIEFYLQAQKQPLND